MVRCLTIYSSLFEIRSQVKTTSIDLLSRPFNLLETRECGLKSLRSCGSNLWNNIWKNGLFPRCNVKIDFGEILNKSYFGKMLNT